MPTPRPSITATVVAKSGIDSTWLSKPARMVPTPMPASAMPIGSPMASTEPNARISTMIAKARPSSSELGTSNSASSAPPSSICTPSISGIASRMSVPITVASSSVTSRGNPICAYAIFPASGPCAAIC